MIKTSYLLGVLMAGGLAVLAGCSTASTSPTVPLVPPFPLANVPSAPEVAPVKQTLVGILWNMATAEKEALPEKILPYFGITEVPPVKMYGAGYGWFSLPDQPQRVADRPLQKFGVSRLGYHYNFLQSPTRERDSFSIELDNDIYCTTANQVIAIFGQSFKRLPARIYTDGGTPNPQTATAIPGALVEKGSLLFETGLFEGRGSITFQFDSAQCAELISLNYFRKNK